LVGHLKEYKLFHPRFEAFTAVTMKNVVFWDVALCRYFVNRRFGGTYPSIFRKTRERGTSVIRWLQTAVTCSRWSCGSSLPDFSTLKIEAIRSSKKSVHAVCTQRHIPEDEILLFHPRSFSERESQKILPFIKSLSANNP
jgi:hypothetical protein